MIITDIKTKFFKILTEDLGYATKDHSEVNEDTIFPNISISTTSIQRTKLHGAEVMRFTFVLDIFSIYDGEKELLEMEEAIFNALDGLYDIDGVVYVQQKGFKILEDKSTGTVMQHGVGRYTVYVAGGIKEVEDETDTTNESGD